ncbi:hypothetical protein Agub_g7502 [Astrephomene gubernaculifera]|uniref:Carbonic anhydrase n=1 Tax=Astrephomene gubernaculifera TaxID=47775 RepID=A0AAD3DQL3_9CHLO|nr:hypothetical protein Agub_g7502 [Astrephomene gubernaculifera]
MDLLKAEEKELSAHLLQLRAGSIVSIDSPMSPSSPIRYPNGSSRLSVESDPLGKLMRKNRAWSAARLAEDPDYFNRLIKQQAPEYLWIGCSDSRVPANAILGLEPGEVFVQRNVGNQATHTDLNCMSCLEYAVKELKVRNIILCGHYGCGAVKAAIKMPSKTHNLVNCWISDIRECRNQHRTELMALPNLESQIDRLCELNVLRQTFNVCTSPVVQSAWDKGQLLHIYGVVYSLKDGLIKKLVGPISGNDDFEEDQAAFAERGSSYVGYTDVMEASDAASSGGSKGAAGGTSSSGGGGAGAAPLPECMSFRARMEAFNAYLNTVEVNNLIAQHVAWTDRGIGDAAGHLTTDGEEEEEEEVGAAAVIAADAAAAAAAAVTAAARAAAGAGKAAVMGGTKEVEVEDDGEETTTVQLH